MSGSADLILSAPAHYMRLYGHYAQFDETAAFARHLTRCLQQGVVYRDFGGFAFGEFLLDDPGHFYIYGWSGDGTLSRFVEQYVANHPDGPHIQRVSWTRTRPDGSRQSSGPHDFTRIRKILSHVN